MTVGKLLIRQVGRKNRRQTDGRTNRYRQKDPGRVTKSMTDTEKVGMMRTQWLCDHYQNDYSQAIWDHVTVSANELAVSGSNPPIISPSRPPWLKVCLCFDRRAVILFSVPAVSVCTASTVYLCTHGPHRPVAFLLSQRQDVWRVVSDYYIDSSYFRYWQLTAAIVRVKLSETKEKLVKRVIIKLQSAKTIRLQSHLPLLNCCHCW